LAGVAVRAVPVGRRTSRRRRRRAVARENERRPLFILR
jgi:hypothetical protein